jgi:hypothetical protein
MPTPDASAFTRQKKLQGAKNQVASTNQKVSTSLYQYAPNATISPVFLPSFTNKLVRPRIGLLVRSIQTNSTMFLGYRPKYIL